MKLKDVKLNIPHYVVVINTANNHISVTKTKYSTIEKSKYLDQFFIYLHLQDRYTYVEKPIVSLSANLEEEIYVGDHYIRFNLNRKYEINYIAFDLITMIQLIRGYYKKNIIQSKEKKEQYIEKTILKIYKECINNT